MLNVERCAGLKLVYILLLICSLSVVSNSFAQSGIDRNVLYPDLKQVLMVMVEVDQEIRNELISKGFGRVDSLDILRQKAIDEANTKILDKLLENYGWPTREMVGKEGVDAAFLIVQHADPDYQRKMLPSIKASFERGDLDGANYALLVDRVLVNDGLPQRYGSQAKIEEGYIILFPIEDRGRVDLLRESMGLEPLSEYIRGMESLYGAKYKAR